jgi:hypothetical protein
MESFPEPSSEAVAEALGEKERRRLQQERRRLGMERRRLEEERRRSLYDTVFGAAAAVLVATGLGLAAGLWAW